jgi:hypothetical protein
MSHRRPVFLAMLGLALSVSTVLAQQPGQGGRRPGGPGGPFGGPGAGGPLGLLANEQVQKELELLPEQIADFGKLRSEMGTKMQEQFAGINFRDLSEDERRKKGEEMRPVMEKMQKELQDKMKAVLLPHQSERLRELFVQARGIQAVEDPDIAAELKLSDDQKKQIADVREKQREKMGALFQNRGQGGGNDEERRKQFETLREETTKLTSDVLSSEQRDQLEKMKGEKVEFELNQPFRGGPGGGGFRGGNRPDGNRPRPGDRPRGDNNGGNNNNDT